MIPSPVAPTLGGDGGITAETLAKVRAVIDANQVRAISTATGLQGYDLAIPAQTVVPQVTPLVNETPRIMGKGNDVHHFKSITSLGWNTSTTSFPGATSEGALPSQASLSVTQLFNVFRSITTLQSVTEEARLRDKSLMGDMVSMMISQIIIGLKLTEEAWLTIGSDYLWAPPVPLQPVAGTGGSIPANTYYLSISAYNANGETFATAAPAPVVVGANGTISCTFFTVPNATGYHVYVGTSAGTQYRQVAGNFSTPSGAEPSQQVLNMAGNASFVLNNYATSATTLPVANGAITVKDTGSVNPNGPIVFNGMLALIFGAGNAVYTAVNGAPSSSFTAAGTFAQSVNLGNNLGLNTMTPHVLQPSNSAGILAYSDIDKLLLWGWMDSRADYDCLYCSAQDQGTVSNILLNNSGTRVVLNQQDNLGNITANARVTKFVNPYTGKLVDVKILPMLPQGTIVAASQRLPYPVAGFDGPVMKVITNLDYFAQEYLPTLANPFYAAAGRVDETMEIAFLGGYGAITGIIPS